MRICVCSLLDNERLATCISFLHRHAGTVHPSHNNCSTTGIRHPLFESQMHIDAAQNFSFCSRLQKPQTVYPPPSRVSYLIQRSQCVGCLSHHGHDVSTDHRPNHLVSRKRPPREGINAAANSKCNQQRVNSTCRRLFREGHLERHGTGGPGHPFTYYPGRITVKPNPPGFRIW